MPLYLVTAGDEGPEPRPQRVVLLNRPTGPQACLAFARLAGIQDDEGLIVAVPVPIGIAVPADKIETILSIEEAEALFGSFEESPVTELHGTLEELEDGRFGIRASVPPDGFVIG